MRSRLAAAALGVATTLGAQTPIAFTHLAVIDGRSPAPRADQTVVVSGTRITAVGPSATLRAPAGARVIDASGKFMIPGLWDMHVHTGTIGGRELLSLYVANGVTGVRDMASEWPTITSWRREIKAGSLVGPRIVASGPYLEGGDVPIAHILTRTPEEGRAGVDSLVKLGVDFVKVHGQLTRRPTSRLRAERERRAFRSRDTCRVWSVHVRRRILGRGALSICSRSRHRARPRNPSRLRRDMRCRARWAVARRRISPISMRGSCGITRG